MFRIRNLEQSEGDLADIRAELNCYPKSTPTPSA